MKPGWSGTLLVIVGCASGSGGTPDAAQRDAATTDAAPAIDGASVDASDIDATTYDAGVDAEPADASETVPPTVESTSPADGTSAQAIVPAISVTFSEAMEPATLTTNTSNSSCSGSLQLSADSFSTCVQMAAAPTSGDATTFTMSPAAPLTSATQYEIRVTTSVEDAAGNALASQFETATGFAVRYYHTITLDGANDFAGAADGFATSTSDATIYISHDDANLYLGLAHDSIEATGLGNKFLYFLFSIDPALATGNALSSDGKAKFGAAGTARMTYHWKERIDGGAWTEFRVGNASDWNTEWGATGKAVHKVEDYVEASIALTEFGGSAPARLFITTFAVDYAGYSGDGAVFDMLNGATDGSAATPVDLYGYIELDLPSSLAPTHGDHWQTF